MLWQRSMWGVKVHRGVCANWWCSGQKRYPYGQNLLIIYCWLFFPKSFELNVSLRGWLQYAQNIHAITLVFTHFKTVFDHDFLFVRDGGTEEIEPGDTQVKLTKKLYVFLWSHPSVCFCFLMIPICLNTLTYLLTHWHTAVLIFVATSHRLERQWPCTRVFSQPRWQSSSLPHLCAFSSLRAG